MSQYYFSIDGTTQQGPVAKEGLRAAGVGPETMVWREGWPDWMPAAKSPELSDLFTGPAASSPPPFAQPQVGSPMGHQPVGGPPRPPYQPPPPSASTNGYAIASLICSICGLSNWCCCGGIVASILGVIFGHIAVGQIRRGQGGGMNIAKAGLIIGYIGIAMGLLKTSFVVSNRGVKWFEPDFNWRFGPGR